MDGAFSSPIHSACMSVEWRVIRWFIEILPTHTCGSRRSKLPPSTASVSENWDYFHSIKLLAFILLIRPNEVWNTDCIKPKSEWTLSPWVRRAHPTYTHNSALEGNKQKKLKHNLAVSIKTAIQAPRYTGFREKDRVLVPLWSHPMCI